MLTDQGGGGLGEGGLGEGGLEVVRAWRGWAGEGLGGGVAHKQSNDNEESASNVCFVTKREKTCEPCCDLSRPTIKPTIPTLSWR